MLQVFEGGRMSILYMLHQTGDLYAPTIGADGLAGYPESASSEDVKCRVEENHEQIQRADGTTVIVDATIFVPAGTTVDNDYKFVTGGYTYLIEKATPARGLTGISHYELLARRIA